jgi:hypothetical protein
VLGVRLGHGRKRRLQPGWQWQWLRGTGSGSGSGCGCGCVTGSGCCPFSREKVPILRTLSLHFRRACSIFRSSFSDAPSKAAPEYDKFDTLGRCVFFISKLRFKVCFFQAVLCFFFFFFSVIFSFNGAKNELSKTLQKTTHLPSSFSIIFL